MAHPSGRHPVFTRVVAHPCATWSIPLCNDGLRALRGLCLRRGRTRSCSRRSFIPALAGSRASSSCHAEPHGANPTASEVRRRLALWPKWHMDVPRPFVKTGRRPEGWDMGPGCGGPVRSRRFNRGKRPLGEPRLQQGTATPSGTDVSTGYDRPCKAPAPCAADQRRLPERKQKEPGLRRAPGLAWREGNTPVKLGRGQGREGPPPAYRTGVAYQLKRGPTNHWVSPSTNFTSPLTPQFWLNLAWAPRRP